MPGRDLVASASAFAWAGGIFGAIYLVMAIVLLSGLGAATLVACVVTGQMITSVLVDHFGAFGLPKHPAGLHRILGGALLAAGVVLMRR